VVLKLVQPEGVWLYAGSRHYTKVMAVSDANKRTNNNKNVHAIIHEFTEVW